MAQLYAKKASSGGRAALICTDDGLLKVDAENAHAGEDTPASGQKTVTTAGSRVAVGSNTDVKNLVIIADLDNSGNIYVGDSTVSSANGAKLPPGGVLPCGAVNLAAIYIDADVSGEGISYYYTR